MNKTELLSWLQEEYLQWETILEQIDPKRMETPGVNGDWSMKDLVAHLTCWQATNVAAIFAAERGAPEPAPPWPLKLKTEDEINAWIYATNHKRPLSDVLDESQQVFQQTMDAVAALPEHVRIDPEWHLVWVGDQRFEAGEFFDHFHDDHEPDLRAWLKRIEKQ